ncbi:MAG: ATP-binding protein [Cypionkella sp.]
MTRHHMISATALQARALDIAADHAVALLSEAATPDPVPALAALDPLGPVHLNHILTRFRLTDLALDLFVLIAAPELGPTAAAVIAEHPLSQRGRATPALCIHCLGPEAGPALSANALLRQSGLVMLDPGVGFAQRALSLPEGVITALHGAPELDTLLLPALTHWPPSERAEPTAPALAEALLRAHNLSPLPILHLETADPAEAADIAAQAVARLGLGLYLLDPMLLPAGLDPARTAQLLNRDLILTEAAVLLPATSEGVLIADRVHAPAMMWGTTPIRTQRPRASFAVLAPPAFTLAEDTFALPRSDMADVVASHATGAATELWPLARRRAGQALEGLAERIEPQASWDDLVLPSAQLSQLQQLAASRRFGTQVLDDWGFRAKSSRGLALTALFSGPSGTGKTMAAEILARELCPADGALALYRVDLSALVSKYIGETQKNVGRIFDAAESSRAVLLFDEGEALFARRSPEVRDSHDRHANSETAYLLQRLETFTGVAIVTTNLRAAVDDAFLRRFRAVVEFPFPDAAQRALIWRKVFPLQVPLDSLDYDALSRLAVTGGFIRAMALTAAYLAAAAGGPVTMAHLERAARQEYGKIGKPLAEAEVRGFR